MATTTDARLRSAERRHTEEGSVESLSALGDELRRAGLPEPEASAELRLKTLSRLMVRVTTWRLLQMRHRLGRGPKPLMEMQLVLYATYLVATLECKAAHGGHNIATLYIPMDE